MSLRVPALDPATSAPRTDSGYPEPYRSRVLPREKRELGEALGLDKIRGQPDDADAGQGILDAPLAHARGRARLRTRG